MKDKFEQFTRPLSFDEIEWRIGSKDKNKATGEIYKTMVLAYIDARTATTRLDDAFGPGGWKTERLEATTGGYTGGVSIKVGDEWVTKWDGSGVNPNRDEKSDNTVKSAVSDIIKRSCVQWGLGKELYKLPKFFIKGDVDYLSRDHISWIEGVLALDEDRRPKRATYEEDREITLEEAKKMKWPCGKDKGASLVEKVNNDPGSIAWILNKTAADKYKDIKAAILLLQKDGKKNVQAPMKEVQRDQIIQFTNRSTDPGKMKRVMKTKFGDGILDKILNLELSEAQADEVLKNIASKKFLQGG